MIKIIPIIDVEASFNDAKKICSETYHNIEKAKRFGADGVMLFPLNIYDLKSFGAFAEEVKKMYAPFWVGIFCSEGNTKYFVEQAPHDLDAIWSDVGVDLYKESHPHAEAMKRFFESSLPNTLHFSDISYLSTQHAEYRYMKKALIRSAPYMDVICNCVSGKNKNEDIEILKIISGVLPLSINGGINPDNISDYLPFIDYCMPQKGLKTSYSIISQKKLEAFIAAVREWEQKNQ